MNRTLLLTVLFLMISVVLFAQGIGRTTGTLAGKVQDESGIPVPGVSIELSGSRGVTTITVDQDGFFIFPYLNPGDYALKAELQGFATVEYSALQIRLGERTELSIIMKPALEETITVLGSPLLDTRSTTIGASLTDELINRVPVERSFMSAIALAPGVSDSGIWGSGSPSIGGASGLENNFILEGVVITNPLMGSVGTTSIFYGSYGSGFSMDAVQAIEVKNAGFEPEYGEAMGGVINVITKSGGNEYAGETYVYFRPDELEAERNVVDRTGRILPYVSSVDTVDAGLNLSGPVLRDRLFFFGSYNPQNIETVYQNDPAAPRYSDFPAGKNLVIHHSYALKFTANILANQTAEFTAFGDPSRSPLANQVGYGLAFDDPFNFRSRFEFGSGTQVGRWTGILGEDIFVEAQAARSEHHFAERPTPEGLNQYVYIDFTTGPPFPVTGGFGEYEETRSTNSQYKLKSTHLIQDHEFRYGVEFQEIDTVGGILLSGPTFRTASGQQTSTGALVFIFPGDEFNVDRIYGANSSITSPLQPSISQYWNWFIQDSWNVTPNFNVKVGVRWEQQKIKAEGEGSSDITFGNNWAPRIGASWDYLKNGRSKLFLHYGRYFQKLPNWIGFAFGNDVGSFDLYYDPALTMPIPTTGETFTDYALEVEGHGSSTSPYETRSTYANEWVIGAEQQFGSDFTLGARFTFRDLQRAIESVTLDLDRACIPVAQDRCIPPILTAEDSLDHNSAVLFTNLDGHYPGSPPLERVYKAFEIVAEKRLSQNWQMLASYRFSDLNGNYEGLFLRDSGEPFPNWSTAGDLADSPFMAFTFDPGPLPNEVRHHAKLFGSYAWEFGLTTGVGLNLQTGRPITRFGAMPGNGVRLLSPRGALGRTDNLFTFDLHADYQISLFDKGRFTFGVDVFNLFNSQPPLEVRQQSQINVTRGFGFTPIPDPDFLKPTFFQDQRSIRLVVKYSF